MAPMPDLDLGGSQWQARFRGAQAPFSGGAGAFSGGVRTRGVGNDHHGCGQQLSENERNQKEGQERKKNALKIS